MAWSAVVQKSRQMLGGEGCAGALGHHDRDHVLVGRSARWYPGRRPSRMFRRVQGGRVWWRPTGRSPAAAV